MRLNTKVSIVSIAALLIFSSCVAGDAVCGSARVPELIRLIGSRKTALLCNQTSMVGNVHLVDTLIKSGVNLSRLFAPEHGFRGTEEAGAAVNSGRDGKTGLPVISLYGERKKPSYEDLREVEVVVFDIQDVGARFFTYISSMTLMMEACAENGIEMIVCDRPNPNGGIIDGPVLEPAFKSFVGQHSVPVMHGMTVGEYAQMVNGEGWLKNGNRVSLKVLSCLNYTHDVSFKITVKPSPNLGSEVAIRAYPTLCFFEGTDIVSVGRGTDRPFERMGNPYWDSSMCRDRFTPHPVKGASMKPMHEGKLCYGFDVSEDSLLKKGGIHIEWLVLAWELSGKPENFFNGFFCKLAGTKKLEQDILAGKRPEEIRASWQKDLDAFRIIRKKYIIYP